MHPSQTYPRDRTADAWNVLKPLLRKPKSGGRPITHTPQNDPQRHLLSHRIGCQWSMLSKDFPPKSTVFDFFSAGRRSGLWQKLNDGLRVKVRVTAGRKPSPSAAILDSQSVKGAEQGGPTVGARCGQEDRRTQTTCARGHPWHDPRRPRDFRRRSGPRRSRHAPREPLHALWKAANHLGRRRYAGALVAWVKGLRPFDKLHLDIARRSDDAKGFQLVKKRWIVKRTLRHRSGQPPRQRWTQRQLKRQDVAGWR